MWCDESWMFLRDVLHTATTTPSIPRWLTVFIDLVIYLFVLNGSWTVSNAFSLSVKMAGGFVLHYINTLFPVTEVECWSNTAVLGKISHSPLQNVPRFGLQILCWGCMHCYSWKIWVCSFLLMAIWLWYWGNTVLIGWIRKCSLLPPVYSGTICEGWVLFLL